MSERQLNDNIQIQWSIKWKLVLGMTILIVTLTLILTSSQISSQKAVLEGELEKRIALMRENLVGRGKSFIMTLVQQIENDIAAFNFSGLQEKIEAGVQTNKEIKYIILVDVDGTAFIHTEHPNLVQTHLDNPRNDFALRQTDVTEAEWSEEGEAVIEIDSPIQFSMQPWGALRLVYTLEHLDAEITHSKAQIKKQIESMVYNSILFSLGFLLLSFLMVFVLSIQLSKPLIQLTRAAKSLSKGNFTISSDLRTNSHDEIGVLARSFIQMSQDLKLSYEQLEEYSRTLEQKVKERTRELQASLLDVENANKKIMQSIQYARLIQHALLPSEESRKRCLPDSFFLWMPRDIVGGDMFFMEELEDGFILAAIDCTGHGVPGAFMTMIASSSLTRIIRDDGCTNPGDILTRLSYTIKNLFRQNQASTLSDNGLDAAVCRIYPAEKRLSFAGARLPLFIRQQGTVRIIPGERQSVGYQRCDPDFQFSNQQIEIERDMSFYLATDGYIDQLGRPRRIRFGTRRFKKLLREQSGQAFPLQQEVLLQAFHKHKGESERQDDVTVVGFDFRHLFKEDSDHA
ncbi:MAG: SpoIIE family protein phosphatase [bacterium]|nr:SpoIIE family protein phosphatase [bacterium]